jgi:CheY-like chemotaxis protein
MQMPEISGLAIGQHVRDRLPKLPVILLSSIGDESKKNYAHIFNSILTKPVKYQRLLNLIQTELNLVKEPVQRIEQQPEDLLSKRFSRSFPLNILVVEDNLINQKLILRILDRLGYLPDLANHGKEALSLLELKNYDIILMDIHMPEMDGLETTRTIRKHNTHQPFIIAMTANAYAEDKEACLYAGMDDYLSKPVKVESLLAALENATLEMGNLI